MPCFLSLALIMACLAATGAGLIPLALSLCAIAASASAFLFSRLAAGRRLILCAAMAVGFILLTAIPLPPWTDPVVGHERARQNCVARQALADAQKLSPNLPRLGWFALTRNRAGSMRIVLLAALMLSGGALAAGADAECKKRMLLAIILLGSAVALAGIAGAWVWPQGKTLLWLIPVEHGRPMGAFMNRNHCGGFAAMLCPAAIAAAGNAAERRSFAAAAAYACAFAALAACAVLSLSRGAWLACGAGLAAMALFQALKRRSRLTAAATALAMIALAAALALPNRTVLERAGSLRKGLGETTIAMRIRTWKDAAPVFLDHPFLGVGANAFRAVFPRYRTASTRPSFKHAENEYVQIPVELGIVGSCALGLLLIAAFSDWRRKCASEGCDHLFVSCAVGAAAAAAAHASCDFAIRIPLYSFTLAAVCGLAWPASVGQRPIAAQPALRCPAAALLAATIAVALHGRSIYRADDSDWLMRASAPELARALAWSPTSWQAWYHFGRRMLEENPVSAQPLAHSFISTAAEYDPLNYRLWAELCMLRASLGDRTGAEEAFSRMKMLRAWMSVTNME